MAFQGSWVKILGVRKCGDGGRDKAKEGDNDPPKEVAHAPCWRLANFVLGAC